MIITIKTEEKNRTTYQNNKGVGRRKKKKISYSFLYPFTITIFHYSSQCMVVIDIYNNII